MARRFGIFGKQKDDAKKGQMNPTRSISETAAIGAGTPQPLQKLESSLKTSLTNALTTLGLGDGAMAEALISTLGSPQLITWEIQPETSVALPSRIRAGRSVVWRAFSTNQPIIANIPVRDPRSREIDTSEATTLFSTRSALAYPIQQNDAVIGVLNIESDRPDAFAPDALARLKTGGILQAIALEMASIRREKLSEATIVKDILMKMDQKIAFTIALDDMTETYYQMLRVAAAVAEPTQVSGGLILIRSQEHNLSTSNGKLFAVRAARIGDFNSEPEWDWKKDISIAHRIYNNKKGEVIPHAEMDPDYQPSGTTHGETCELIVPLIDKGGESLGVIGLVTPGIGTFSRERDLPNVDLAAQIASYAVSRSSTNATNKRHAAQRDCAIELQRLLAPLFPKDGGNITRQEIRAVRQNVSTKILQWATQYTNSEHGAFALAEVTEGQQTYLAMHTDDQITNAPVNDTFVPRWPKTEGISGKAYSTRETQSEPNIPARNGEGYIPYFPAAQSEVAVPLLIGETALGVLDVESNETYHFTSDYIDWIEFLAVQAAFALSVIERAVKRAMSAALADLSQNTGQTITAIHGETDIEAVRTLRNDTAKSIIERMCEVLGCWVGRFVTELNTYKPDGSIDERHGRLFYLASTDAAEVPKNEGREARTFPFGDGISSRAFREKQMIVFNDRATRDALGKYFDSDAGRNAGTRSGIFLPVLEGTRITGILNLEGEREDIFTPDAIQACQMAADLISTLMTASRIGILDILRDNLRDIEIEILRAQSANLSDFMRNALLDAARLAGITAGWGTIMQTWSIESGPSTSDGKPPMIERFFQCEYAKRPTAASAAASAEASDQPGVEVMAFRMEEEERPLPVTYAPFVEALNTKKPVVILDQDDELDERRWGEPWPHPTSAGTPSTSATARSVVCVPLLRPLVGGEKGAIEAAGVLALAHPNVAEFSDFDKEILSMFAESLVGGINAVALLQSRAELIGQVRHDLSIAISPLDDYRDVTQRALEVARKSSDIDQVHQQLGRVSDLTDQVGLLVELTGDLSGWLLDLSNDELGTLDSDEANGNRQPATHETQTVTDVLEPFDEPIRTFVGAFKRPFDCPPIEQFAPLHLLGGEVYAQLIRAALFQYIDNAIKYGDPGSSIRLDVKSERGYIVFEVSSAGLPILEKRDQERIFRLNARGTLAQQLQTQAALDDVVASGNGPQDSDSADRDRRLLLQRLLNSAGFGLFHVRDIARHRLGGDADYRIDPTSPLQNVFWLSIPQMP